MSPIETLRKTLRRHVQFPHQIDPGVRNLISIGCLRGLGYLSARLHPSSSLIRCPIGPPSPVLVVYVTTSTGIPNLRYLGLPYAVSRRVRHDL